MRRAPAALRYLDANAWELFVSVGITIRTIFYLVFPSFFSDVPVARAFTEPLDGFVSALALSAGILVFYGLVWRKPRIRVAGLVLLIGTILISTLAQGVVYNWHVALYGVPTAMLVIGPSIIRIRRIMLAGDYPPILVTDAVPVLPVLEPREP